MTARKKQLEQSRKHMIRELCACEDRADSDRLTARIRKLRYRFEERSIRSASWSSEILQDLEELKPLLVRKNRALTELYLDRLETLSDNALRGEQRGEKCMGIFTRLKASFGKDKKGPQDKLLRTQEDAEKKIFQLEKKIVELSDQRTDLMRQLHEKVKACASLEPDSYEYKLIRQQAMTLRPRISNIEKQVSIHLNLLQSNAQYRTMLESGRTTFEIRNYMPDPAEADMLMQLISDRTAEIVGDLEDFGQSVSAFGEKIDRAGTLFASEDDEEFDRMVLAQKKTEKTVSEGKPSESSVRKSQGKTGVEEHLGTSTEGKPIDTGSREGENPAARQVSEA